MWLPSASQKGMKRHECPSFTAVNGQLRISKTVQSGCEVKSQGLGLQQGENKCAMFGTHGTLTQERLGLGLLTLLCIFN